MLRRITIATLLLMSGFITEAQDATNTEQANLTSTTAPPSGRRLREIAAEKFTNGNIFIGGTTHGRLFGTPSLEILNREFNYITPANDYKQTYIHPEPGKWRWELPDQWLDSAKLHNQLIRMHSPISPQASKWAKDDTRTAEELETNMTEYMTELCTHFNGEPEIRWMDVVNETIERDGSWFGPKAGTDKWENPWPLIGYDQTEDGLNPPSYIRMAFEIANEHAPDIQLIYNQHGDMEDAMWDKTKQTVLYLRSLGLRVDGIGWQAHLETDFLDDENNIPKLKALIDWAHENDLEFHITENDVDILEGDTEEDQAEIFRTIVQTVVEKGVNGMVTWNAWQIRDSDGNGAAGKPTLFNDDGSAKPAYFAVQEVLENSMQSVNLSLSTDGNGQVSHDGGEYLQYTQLALTATPETGYIFKEWTGDISSQDNPLLITLDTDLSLSAVFVAEGEVLDPEDPVMSSGTADVFKLYPNPSDGGFNIDLVAPSDSITRVQVFKISGALIHEEVFNPEIQEIHINRSWEPGVYAVRIQQDELLYSHVLIIR